MPLPYAGLLEQISQTPTSGTNYFGAPYVTARFKTWINNETRLNATNMNELVKFIQDYSKQIGNAVDTFLSPTLEQLVELNAGWKMNTDSTGEIFNDYENNIASGDFSHAGGTNSQATGDISFVFGEGLIAANKYQFVIGSYNNNKTDTLFEIGNGTSDSKSNAFEVKTDGKVIGGMSDLTTDDTDTTLTPKGYVDKQDEELQRQIDLLEQLNEWLGSIQLTQEQMVYWDSRFDTGSENYTNFVNLLTSWVTTNESRQPRNGDELTVIPDGSGLTTEDIPYPELWMFVENDNDPQTTDGEWKFFSSLQQIRNASATVKGVVKLGANIVNDENDNLILSWSKW